MEKTDRHHRRLQLSSAKKMAICPDCVSDIALKAWIKVKEQSRQCSFCGKSARGNIALECSELVRYIYDSLGRKYIDDCVFPDLNPDLHEYPVLLSTEQVLEKEMGGETNKEFVALVHKSLGEERWLDLDLLDAEPFEDKLINSWEDFCRFIRHQRRFFFLQEYRRSELSFSRSNRPFSPSEILEAVGKAAEEFGLITRLKRGTCVYRSRRAIPGAPFKTSLDLGPPNEELAKKSNRMSPAGIVMFYASDTPETAIMEIGGLMSPVVVGMFVIEKNITILDLSCLPPEPSIFSLLEEEELGSLKFLHHFRSELSAKVEADGYEHVGYVPTQVVTEWFRTVFRHNKRRIQGICYPSAQHEGGRSLVLFANQSDVVLPKGVAELAVNAGIVPISIPSLDAMLWILSSQDKPWLRLISTKRYRAKAHVSRVSVASDRN